MLLDRQTFSRLLSALPFLQQIATPTQTQGALQSVVRLRMAEVLGVMDFSAHVLRVLALLQHLQKRLGLSLQLLGAQLQAALQYEEAVCRYFTADAPPDTAPLLDTLALIGRSFAQPADMPAYLNARSGC